MGSSAGRCICTRINCPEASILYRTRLNHMASSIQLKSLAARIDFCTPAQAARGLMFTRPRDRALVFTFSAPAKVALHMWFVFYRIDVLYLDGAGRVLEIIRDFKPFSYYRPKSAASYVVELPRKRAEDIIPGTRIQGLLPDC